jgi:catechol 2,3-dioxygenase-like lactoylglutathione lyase family enzyme
MASRPAHVGILVHDIDAAIEHWGRLLGVHFMPPRTVQVDRMVDAGGDGPLELTVSFSTDGAPEWELLQATGNGVYAADQGEGIHHIALLDDDPAARADELVALGARDLGRQYRPDGTVIVVYLDRGAFNGVPLEILDAATQPAIDAWIAGEEAEA